MSKIVLRNYQIQAIDDIEAMVAFGSDNIVLHAETSYGKSITMAGLCERFNDKHIIILVNIEPLIDQISFFLKELDIDYSILKAKRESEFNSDARVQLVMSQTYFARADKLNIKADIVIQDEIHKEYDTPRTQKLLADINPELRIGLSATPWTASGFALSGSETISTESCNDLTDQGYLSPIHYFIPKWSEKVDYSKVKKTGADYNMSSLDEVIGSDVHIEQVVESMNQLNAKKKKTLVFCSTIDICNNIEKALIEDGYNAAAYHSKKSKSQNQRIMESFKQNQPYAGSDEKIESEDLFTEPTSSTQNNPITTLISVSKLNVGFSVNDIDLGVIVRPSKILSLFRQMAGRVRRTSNSLDEILEKYKDQ